MYAHNFLNNDLRAIELKILILFAKNYYITTGIGHKFDIGSSKQSSTQMGIRA